MDWKARYESLKSMRESEWTTQEMRLMRDTVAEARAEAAKARRRKRETLALLDEAMEMLDEVANHDSTCVWCEEVDPEAFNRFDGSHDEACRYRILRDRVDATRPKGSLRPQAPDATASPDYEDA